MDLMARAREAAQNAYCPYSNFHVGAAVATDAGVFVGGNIENASYGLTVCAERVALFAAIAGGAKQITRMAVTCADAPATATAGSRMPCGACRQVMAEFMEPESIVEIDGVGERRVMDLLPDAFLLEEQPFLRPEGEMTR